MDREERTRNLEAALIKALEGLQSDIWTALPVVITQFDPVRMTAEAQPTIRGTVRQPDGTVKEVDMPLLVDVPVIFPSGGGFTLTFPIKPGDEGLCFFASRCIDSWWERSGVQSQAEFRMHDLSDSFVLVGPRSQPRVLLPTVHPDNVQLRSDDGQAVVEIKPNHDINITTVGDINMTAGGNVKIIGTRIDLNP